MALSKIGIIGDVHAEDKTLFLVLKMFRDQMVDAIFCVGDIVDGPGDVDRCCELLKSNSVITVRGNHDRWFLENTMRDLPEATLTISKESHSYLESLPRTKTFDSLLGKIFLCHGIGENDMSLLKPNDYGYAIDANDDLREILKSGFTFVIGGHSHAPMVRTFGDTTFINPGTLLTSHGASAFTAKLDKKLIQRYTITETTLKVSERYLI